MTKNIRVVQKVVMLAVTVGIGVALVISEGCRSRNAGTGAQLLVASGTAHDAASTPIRFGATPARLERGKYLVEGVAHCFQCHSTIDWKTRGGPYVKEKRGAGHDWADFGFPFLVAPNITPDPETGAGKWSDEDIARAIREGVGHDGRRLFPIMPYERLAKMSDEDLASVVAYIRTIKPVRNSLGVTKLPEEIKQSLPPVEHVSGPVESPDLSDPVKRGEYLVTIGNCTECHTPKDKRGASLPGLYLSGGFVLEGPWGKVASANLTSDPSGLSYYDEQMFVEVIRTGQVKARQLSSIMPWNYFRNMSDEDLKAIFAYLKTIPQVKHRVDNTEAPTYCKVCGFKHGFGDRN